MTDEKGEEAGDAWGRCGWCIRQQLMGWSGSDGGGVRAGGFLLSCASGIACDRNLLSE